MSKYTFRPFGGLFPLALNARYLTSFFTDFCVSFQFVCVAQADYYRILTQGERSIQCIKEDGDVVMITEFRKTDGGSRQGQVVIKVCYLVNKHPPPPQAGSSVCLGQCLLLTTYLSEDSSITENFVHSLTTNGIIILYTS